MKHALLTAIIVAMAGMVFGCNLLGDNLAEVFVENQRDYSITVYFGDWNDGDPVARRTALNISPGTGEEVDRIPVERDLNAWYQQGGSGPNVRMVDGEEKMYVFNFEPDGRYRLIFQEQGGWVILDRD